MYQNTDFIYFMLFLEIWPEQGKIKEYVQKKGSPDKAFEGSWLRVDTQRYPIPLLLLQDELMNDLYVGEKEEGWWEISNNNRLQL